MDNTDDHEKNHAFVRAADGFYDLSLAYDVVPSVQGLGQQQLRVGKGEAESSIDNALSQVEAFGLKKDSAVETIRRVAGVVDGWQAFFQRQGVGKKDLDLLAQYIDGPNLKAQRDEFIDRKTRGLSR
ncbi:HipA domain-containing protein [Roseateles saccharophilus]